MLLASKRHVRAYFDYFKILPMKIRVHLPRMSRLLVVLRLRDYEKGTR